MIKKSTLNEVIRQQLDRLKVNSTGLERELLSSLPVNLVNHALIISGIRRCGKSTLLHQLLSEGSERVLFLNFDTPKLYDFEIDDFTLLDEIIIDQRCDTLFFDEIQVVEGWELYVRQKLDEGFRVVVTGSNASLLSKELGTKLTGRHVTKELFPFSFKEYCNFKGLPGGEASLYDYLNTGGFPEFVKTQNQDVLEALTDDILYRDIAVRHNIKDVKSLKHLLVFLASNVGNLVTATKLTQFMNVKSAATILDYFSFFEKAYLMQLMPKFSYSYKVQMINPRKIYFIDNGLLGVISASFNSDLGRRLENMVFWELRRRHKELFYFNEQGRECDFVVCENNKPVQLIQVCYELNQENEKREQQGLFDAMDFFNMSRGVIITFNQQDVTMHQGKRIDIIPAFSFFTQPGLNI